MPRRTLAGAAELEALAELTQQIERNAVARHLRGRRQTIDLRAPVRAVIAAPLTAGLP